MSPLIAATVIGPPPHGPEASIKSVTTAIEVIAHGGGIVGAVAGRLVRTT
jgi:hypothetical protein